MSSTVENINANIELQFTTLSLICEHISGYELDDKDELILHNTQELINSSIDAYYSSVVDILKDYYMATDDNTKKILHNKFVKAFHSSNLVGEIKRIYLTIVKLRKTYEFNSTDLNKLCKQFETTTIDESFSNTSSDICPKCHTQYDIEEKTSEFTCKNCGHVEKMYGVVFEDDQFYYQEGQRTKHGKYDPIKHARFWLDRIQAKETTEIPDSVINAVKKCICRDQLWKHDVTCELIRGYLKQIKKNKITSYNNHVALIRKIITGQEPDQLSEYEIKLVYMYFGLSIQIYNKIKGDSKMNCLYHPFLIYKIIEQILTKPGDMRRRKNILSCIHLQSRDTLIENDKVWFGICDHIPGFTKIATDGGAR
jgi:hypothetical protein